MTVNRKQFGFTIVELLLAISLLGIILVSSGIVFQKAVRSHRLAEATSEITQKLQAITDQLETDFASLRKDGEIFLVWVPFGIDDDGDGSIDRYERLDRMLFFTSGDFVSYNTYVDTYNQSYITGNVALVCYTFARDVDNVLPESQDPSDRILIRSQNILTSDSGLDDMPILPLDTNATAEAEFRDNFFQIEYTTLTMDQWLFIPYSEKLRMLSAVTYPIEGSGMSMPEWHVGPQVDLQDPSTINILLADGVGEFIVQGWSDTAQRWVPMYDPDGDSIFTDDSDFRVTGSEIDTTSRTGVIYPRRTYSGGSALGFVSLGSQSELYGYANDDVTQDNFNNIPGLGRALKFTFTLYDSLGVFEDGKTFTHIVYLDR